MGKMEMRMALLEPANNDDENKQNQVYALLTRSFL